MNESRLYSEALKRNVSVPVDEVFTLNGEEVRIEEFLADNGFTDTAEDEAIALMKIGEVRTYGGGATPLFKLKRIA